jgi:CheY-like chemotaxis protein
MPALSDAPSRTGTVMIVDDEEGICETLRDVFEDEGYKVGVATNGQEALWLLKTVSPKPCIVILDLLMPVLDGNAVYRAMKADPALANIPVVISTSDPSRAPSGALIMRKPLALEVLLSMVRRCC